MTKQDNGRFWLAVAVFPALPLTVLPLQVGYGYWPLIFFFGYLFSWLMALPIMAVVMTRPTMASCSISGGVAGIVPVALITILSLLFGEDIFTWRTLQDFISLFSLGAAGGALFWLIAFWRVKP